MSYSASEVDANPFSITRIDGPKTVVLKNDYLISGKFLDPRTGAVLLDLTGDRAKRVSELLEDLPSDSLALFLEDAAIPMVLIAAALDGEPQNE